MTARVDGVRTRAASGQPEITGANPEASLLPSPPQTSAFGGSSLLALQKVLMNMSDSSIGSAEARLQRNEKLVRDAIEKAHEARMREAEARSEDGGFFDGLGETIEAFTVDLAKLENLTDPVGAVERSLDRAYTNTIDSRQFWADLEKGALEVAKWGAVAASVTLAVLSCGAAAPVAALAICGAVMSCAAAADSTFNVLEKCGVDKETAGWIDVGLCVGGAVCSGGAGFAQGMASAGTTAAQNGSEAMRAVAIGSIVIDATAGGAAIVGGVAHTQVARYERDAKLAEADNMEAIQTQQRVERRIERTLEAIREALESRERGLSRVGEAMQRENTMNLAMVRA